MIAVTGVTGFIGAHLCRRLVEQGYSVRGLVRRPAIAAEKLGPQVELVIGNLDEPDSLARLISGCQAVIHCAGSVRGCTLDDFTATNVRGTENLCSVMGARSPDMPVLILSSLAAREPKLSHYAASKRMAEKLLLDRFSHLDFTVIRPPAVYGPGDRELLPLFRLMARGVAVVPGCLSQRLSLIYVNDLVDAMIAWLGVDKPPKGVFTIADPAVEGYSWDDIIATASTVFNRPVRRLSVPAGLLYFVSTVNLVAAGLFNYSPMLTPGKVRELCHPDWCCSGTELGEIIGWRPKVAFAEGLKRTLT